MLPHDLNCRCDESRLAEEKAFDIGAAWESHHYDFELQLDSKMWEVEEMWAEWEGNYALNDYLHSTFRNKLPEDWERFLRNDPLADCAELRLNLRKLILRD